MSDDFISDEECQEIVGIIVHDSLHMINDCVTEAFKDSQFTDEEICEIWLAVSLRIASSAACAANLFVEDSSVDILKDAKERFNNLITLHERCHHGELH